MCESLNNLHQREIWNVPLLQTDHFVVLPSLGAMVKGWLLIVPKKHFMCMGAVPDALETDYFELRKRVCTHLESVYGSPVVLFEHGPSRILTRTGCGVDHAHVHVVPFAEDLIKLATPYLSDTSGWYPATQKRLREAYSAGLDYLYAEVPGHAALMATSREFGSQVFRRAIADSLLISNEYQWREFLRLETVAGTISDFRTGAAPTYDEVEYAA
jgi:diadenosine tetraphosphate (Ap4A) HIT family hydrolase